MMVRGDVGRPLGVGVRVANDILHNTYKIGKAGGERSTHLVTGSWISTREYDVANDRPEDAHRKEQHAPAVERFTKNSGMANEGY